MDPSGKPLLKSLVAYGSSPESSEDEEFIDAESGVASSSVDHPDSTGVETSKAETNKDATPNVQSSQTGSQSLQDTPSSDITPDIEKEKKVEETISSTTVTPEGDVTHVSSTLSEENLEGLQSSETTTVQAQSNRERTVQPEVPSIEMEVDAPPVSKTEVMEVTDGASSTTGLNEVIASTIESKISITKTSSEKDAILGSDVVEACGTEDVEVGSPPSETAAADALANEKAANVTPADKIGSGKDAAGETASLDVPPLTTDTVEASSSEILSDMLTEETPLTNIPPENAVAVDVQVNETGADGASALDIPAKETLAVTTPADKSPASAGVQAIENTTREMDAVKTAVTETEEFTAVGTAAEKKIVMDIPAIETNVNDTPAVETKVKDTPAVEALPLKEADKGETSVVASEAVTESPIEIQSTTANARSEEINLKESKEVRNREVDPQKVMEVDETASNIRVEEMQISSVDTSEEKQSIEPATDVLAMPSKEEAADPKVSIEIKETRTALEVESSIPTAAPSEASALGKSIKTVQEAAVIPNPMDNVKKGKEGLRERRKKSPSPEKFSPGGRRLRQIRHPSVKAAEAAADAAFVAAVVPTRKNLKEAKIACAIANVSESSEKNFPAKTGQQPNTRSKRGNSANQESLTSTIDCATHGGSEVDVSSGKDDVKESRTTSNEGTSSEESDNSNQSSRDRSVTVHGIDTEKPVGIKLKISKESVEILDPPLKKLEVQIPSDTTLLSDTSSSPGGTRRIRKLRDETASPTAPLSPITLKIAKSKEGLEVVPSDSDGGNFDSEKAKVEKITLKLAKGDSASIVKHNTASDDSAEGKLEKITLKLTKDVGASIIKGPVQPQENTEETKLEKITLKLSKDDGACIIRKKDNEIASSSSDVECGKLEKITLKVSNDKNVSIVRPKDSPQPDSSLLSSPESGKVEKITLKVSKHDNISIVKSTSPVPLTGVEKLTLKVAKDGTAAVSGKSRDDSPSYKDTDNSKLEKITLKLSKDEGISIVKPSSPTPERRMLKLSKEEPLSPLSPLVISRSEEGEPHKERITLKLSKAGGHPSPVGVSDERSSWSIKSTDSDTAASPVASESTTPKLKPKRALSETPEAPNTASKRLKLTDIEHPSEDSDETAVACVVKDEVGDSMNDLKQSKSVPTKHGLEKPLEVEAKKAKLEATPSTQANVWPSAGKSVEVVDLDSDDSNAGPPSVVSDTSNQQSANLMDVEDEIQTLAVIRRKPRGRPRKAVLTPGSKPFTAASPPVEETSPVSKSRRERVKIEPVESDRPKRSCKGREKPPPKPVKQAKPRGRNAALKQKQLEETASMGMKVEEPQLFEEETRMSADGGSTPAPSSMLSTAHSASGAGQINNGLVPKVLLPRLSATSSSVSSTPGATPAPSPGPVIINEESQGSFVSSNTTESTPNKGNRKGRMEINVDPDAKTDFTVDMIAEYTWPITDGRGGESYMVQEQISEYLGVKSFKRKYPNMQRRTMDHDERQYLLERKLVTESLCDLGLTALLTQEVYDIMVTDFPEKFQEYRRFSCEKLTREMSNKQRALLAGGPAAKEDSKSKAMRNMASFNSMLNRTRRDQHRCCLDLQNFTVNYPADRRKSMTPQGLSRIGSYPLALVPGQYTDYYKEYTPAELCYFPLNTVLYGPLLPHEMIRAHAAGGSDGSLTDSSDSCSSDGSSSDSGSSGSDSDSDSDSSSDSEDESSSQTGTGTADSHESELDRPDAICRVCNGDRLKNKAGRSEPLVHCAICQKSGHPSCMDLTVDMIPHIRKYSWHCTDCKLCAQCNDTADEDKMLFCDMCDRGYHIYCVGLRKVPEGRWHCKECAMCSSCGARDAGGTEEQQAVNSQSAQETPTKIEIPQWQHEFKKGEEGKRVYVRTLCVPCSKLWKKGRYCRLCWKCYSNQPEDDGLINCSVCDRWMHADCCRKAGRVIDTEKLGSFLCELCQQKGVRIPTSKMPVKLFKLTV